MWGACALGFLFLAASSLPVMVSRPVCVEKPVRVHAALSTPNDIIRGPGGETIAWERGERAERSVMWLLIVCPLVSKSRPGDHEAPSSSDDT